MDQNIFRNSAVTQLSEGMMKSLSYGMTALAISMVCAVTASGVSAAPEFVNGLALDGALLDRNGGTDPNNGRVGYFSDLYYNAQRKQWYGLSDRGPAGALLTTRLVCSVSD